MGVYINDMKMPARCTECRLSTVHSFQDRPLCDVLVKYMTYGEWETKRQDDCPLVPVPPHGRLIDADALFKLIGADEHLSVLEVMYVQSLLSATPTIIPADLKEDSNA